MKCFGFSKREIVGLGSILLIIFCATALNLRVSIRKGRDSQRKADLRRISDVLGEYNQDFGIFPFSDKGRIVACVSPEGELDEQGKPILVPCEWAFDGISPYIEALPSDIHHGQGARYYYLSNGKRFQIYASLESSTEPEYDPKIVARNLACGNRVCNFGLALGKTPLDKSIEEYENEMRDQ